MNSLVALPIVAALPVAAPAMTPTKNPSDEQLVAAANGLLAADEAIDQMHRQHTASGAAGDVDEDPDYQALQVERNEHIATLILVPATSTAGVRAKAAALRSLPMIEDYDQHQQIAVSLADDLVGAGPTIAPEMRPVADAELVELGRRFEPLVDRYYVAQRRWSRSLAAAHAEHDQEFGDPADRNYEYPPEIVAAFSDSCERSGAKEADDALSAIHDEMKQLATAITAASVTSIEGLRTKALVAFWEVAPLAAGDTEFSFDDAYPFQQLFTAVAELCGLKGKMAATGYELPDIGGDDSDDAGEEA